jgi:death-on-curing protein
MTEPLWLDRDLVLLLHDDILGATGGAAGVRDEGLLDSALARPVNRFAYEGVDELIELAAIYAVAIASNHPFVDGNKRAAFMALGVFLEDNGLMLAATDDDATEIMLGVARGEVSIEILTEWLRPRVEPL